MAKNPNTVRPSFSTKTWATLSERTRKRWGNDRNAWLNSTPEQRKAVEGKGGVRNTEGNYWRTRAINLAKKTGYYPNKEKHLNFSLENEKDARLYVLGRVPQRFAGENENNKAGLENFMEWKRQNNRAVVPEIGPTKWTTQYLRGNS